MYLEKIRVWLNVYIYSFPGSLEMMYNVKPRCENKNKAEVFASEFRGTNHRKNPGDLVSGRPER